MRWSILALLLVATLIVGVIVVQVRPTAAQGTTLRVMAPDSPVSGSQPFDVQVRIEGANDLAAFEFDVVYDPAIISLTGMTLGSVLGTGTECNANTQRCAAPLGPLTVEEGRKSIGGYTYGTGSGASGEGTVATLHFSPVTPGSSSIALQNVLVTNTEAVPGTPEALEDSVTVNAAENQVFIPLILHNAP